MNKKSIEDIIESEGIYMCTTVGVSMYPMLRNRRDTVVILPKSGRLKKYDVPLYRVGKKYVLHRVIKVLPEKGYNIRGDNCFCTEKNIPEEAVIGVLSEFWRNGKRIDTENLSYKIYSRLWVFLHPLICFVKRVRGYLSHLIRK